MNFLWLRKLFCLQLLLGAAFTSVGCSHMDEFDQADGNNSFRREIHDSKILNSRKDEDKKYYIEQCLYTANDFEERKIILDRINKQKIYYSTNFFFLERIATDYPSYGFLLISTKEGRVSEQ